MKQTTFPVDFTWGTATSAYQIEGAVDQDGRGPSIWDTFAAQKGAIADQSSGAIACNHYGLWQKDIDLMKSLGLNAYRFSTAWPRILPQGRGTPNQKGLDFYSNLVDSLLEAGITPWLTLYHWDLPQALQDKGGWTNRATVDAFVEYAEVMATHLGDRVKHWITHNEPWCISVLGHLEGEHAPGIKDHRSMMQSAHHVLLSHGLAVPKIRAHSAKAQVGITLNLCPAYGASQSEADRKAQHSFDGQFNRWFLDPLYKGQYPADIIEEYSQHSSLDFVKEGDLKAMQAPLDFLGINYYSRAILRDRAAQNNEVPTITSKESEFTEMGWEVYPQGLFDILSRIHKDYDAGDLYITENGAAYGTSPDAQNQEVDDQKRISYFQSHLEACRDAINDGIPLKGYFAWSLLDNFEWAHGYKKRFGLVWVDYETQKRIPKNSAYWYRDFIEQNRHP